MNEKVYSVDEQMQNLGVEIELKNDNFLCVLETLQRIGVASKNNDIQKLYQTAHILHKQGRYFILHFKEMFLLDGKTSTLSDDDIMRRNTIIKLLEQWNLIKIKNPEKVQDVVSMKFIKVISFKEKHKWELISKYSIGHKHY